MQTRIRRDIEPRWVAEYCMHAYRDLPVRYRCPLGPISEERVKQFGLEKAARVERPWRPEVDALLIDRSRLILVEAKVFKYMDGLSKLPVYKSLVPQTPELENHWKKPVRMELLLPARVEWIENASKRFGVDVIHWAPEWIVEVWKERDRYWTKTAIEQREIRKKVLREHGYE